MLLSMFASKLPFSNLYFSTSSTTFWSTLSRSLLMACSRDFVCAVHETLLTGLGRFKTLRTFCAVLAFFWQVHSHYLFSTDSWFIRRWSARYFANFWGLIEPLLPLVRFLLLLGQNSSVFFFLGPGFAFYPRTFIHSGTFHDDEMISISWRIFESATTLKCKQKMLMSWNRISWMKPFDAKRLLGSQCLVRDYDTLVVYYLLLKKSLFLNNLHTF